MYFRLIKDQLKKALIQPRKIILLYGARQTGKTTLINDLIQELPYKSLTINADEIRYIDVLSSRDLNKFKLMVEGYELLFIDEAQRIPDAGINLKILHDGIPELRIIITGSSSLELVNRTKEPLTGRLNSFELYPISMGELRKDHNSFELGSKLEELMIFGSYPDILNTGNAQEKQKQLMELSSSYLFKDILELANIRHSRKLVDLLRLLSFQIGSQVALTELSNSLGMSKETVASYIDLLEKSFVLFRLRGFSKNLRKEVTKMDKFYFYDLGIRNALINNFNPIGLRNDTGHLWENFIILERVKFLRYSQKYTNMFFWRTYSGAEIDLIEESEGLLSAYEIKYKQKNSKIPPSWSKTYQESKFKTINSENYLEFIT